MEINGKKQIDIREDNKSAVIDLLLKSEMTVLDMASALDLSHTSIAKVIKELLQKNVVQVSDEIVSCFGRPPKKYKINSDCAIACVVSIDAQKIYVYYLDMRGFQVNKIEKDNVYQNIDDLISFVSDNVCSLKNHPRLIDKLVKYIYIGIPNEGLCGLDYTEVSKCIVDKFSNDFPDIGTIIHNNTNYSLLAEVKYGVLRNKKGNALLVDFGKIINGALLINGEVYCGDFNKQGTILFDEIFNKVEDIEQNKEKIAKIINGIVTFLDVHNIVFSGIVTNAEWFLTYMQRYFGEKVNCMYSLMRKDVPASLSGAVWQSTYSTLMKIMLR